MIDFVPIANVGVLALYLLFIWLASAIVGAYLSQRKGYGEKAGLASGLLLSALGAIMCSSSRRLGLEGRRSVPLAARGRLTPLSQYAQRFFAPCSL